MKKFALAFTFLLTANSFADELHNFNAIKLAAMTGKSIHIAIDFSKCSTTQNNTTQSINIGIFSPNAIMVTDNQIVTSFTHFTLNNQVFPGKPVYEFVRYSITPDNQVTLTDQALDAISYVSLTEKFVFNCKIDMGAKIYT